MIEERKKELACQLAGAMLSVDNDCSINYLYNDDNALKEEYEYDFNAYYDSYLNELNKLCQEEVVE
jgi:hypothetical protein